MSIMNSQISIIVPVYKAESYLHRCIDSILAQTFTDFELILIDDGSPDRCPAICDEYKQKDRRIQVIHKKNGGVSSARNAGLDASTGQYIMFCDADDWVEQNWIERLVDTVIGYPDNWIVCGINKLRGGVLGYSGTDKTRLLSKREYFLVYKEGLSAYCWNKIYQKNIIEEYNIRFDCNVSNGEDILFNIDYLKYVNGILEIPDVLYNYNLNNNSITVRYNAKRFENSKFAYYIRLCMIDEHYMVDYSEILYYRFWQDINNVWDEKNTWGFSEKIQYCNSILTSTEFRECYDKIDKTSINKIYLNLIEKGNYLWIFFYEKIRNLFK